MSQDAFDLLVRSEPARRHCPPGGIEWVIDATGCDALPLADLKTVRNVCEAVVTQLELGVVGQPQWHQFPEPAGVTGLYLLSESHLACHTFPEHRLATFNLYCCRRRATLNWENLLSEWLGATNVTMVEITRGLAQPAPRELTR